MTTKINTIIEDLKSLTLLEAAELVKEIEVIFGVDASYSTTNVVAADLLPNVSENNVQEQEKVEFNILLEDVPASKKIAILKVVRSLTGLGLKEAKSLVESVPKVIKESVTKEVAEDIKKKLEDVGARVVVQ